MGAFLCAFIQHPQGERYGSGQCVQTHADGRCCYGVNGKTTQGVAEVCIMDGGKQKALGGGRVHAYPVASP